MNNEAASRTKDPFNRRKIGLTQKTRCVKLIVRILYWKVKIMEHIKTIETRNLCESAKNGGCGECQTSCQSACKTSCGIANQKCENTKESK